MIIFKFFSVLLCSISNLNLCLNDNEVVRYNASINDSSVVNLIDDIYEEQGESFINRFSNLYFYNLRDNFPLNTHGTCAFTALSMLLSFYDTYWDDRIVDEIYECNTSYVYEEINSIYSELPPLDVTSPGLTFADFNSLEHITNYYNDYVIPHNNSDLQSYLIYLANPPLGSSNSGISNNNFGLTLNEESRLLDLYFLLRGFNCSYSPESETQISIVTYNSSDENFMEDVLCSIVNGQPVLLNINSSLVGHHTVIAYDYNSDSEEIYVHSGWRDENGRSLYHVSLNQLATTSIDSALSLIINSSHENHSLHYISSSGQSFCSCCFNYKGAVNFASVIYRNVPPVISFKRFDEENWCDLQDISYSIYYFNIRGYEIDHEDNVSYPTHTIDSHIWDYLNRTLDQTQYNIEIRETIVTDDTTTTYLLASMEMKMANDYYETACIKSTDYGYSNIFTTNKISSRIPVSHNADGFLFETTRFRAASTTDGFVTLSCSGNGFDKSFIEYTFEDAISFVSLQAYIPYLGFNSNYNFEYTFEVKNNTDNEWIECNVSHLRWLSFAGYSLVNPKWIELSFGNRYNQFRISGKSTGYINGMTNKGLLYIGDIALWENLPLSGAERNYNPDLWNSDSSIRELNNCYSYAIDFINLDESALFLPGFFSNYLNLDDDINSPYYNKTEFENRVFDDGLTNLLSFDFKRVGKYEKCLPGYYKIALTFGTVYSYSEFKDFHWYKQNNDGTWSHKRGSLVVTNTDSDDKIIYDPENCDSEYNDSSGNHIIYNEFIGFYQIKINRGL